MGMSFLLDTHIVLWLVGEPGKIPADILEPLGDPTNRLVVSAASAMEVATKVRLGRLDAATGLVHGWRDRIAEIGAEELTISSEHAILAGSMSWSHRDPFDRLLVAQALRENLTLVTVDRAILHLPGVPTSTW